MGLMQAAVETYDMLEKRYAGKVVENQAALAPISHILTNAQIEITLDGNGKYLSGTLLDKSEPKIIIPVTEESSGRTSSPCAHPLCDQLGYLAEYNEEKHKLYVDQLTEWNESEHSHPLLAPVLNYIRGGTILQDLSRSSVITLDKEGKPADEKMLVRWRVNYPGERIESWRDQNLFQSFIAYYRDKKATEEMAVCMISGEKKPIATQHPKGVIAINGNAKLISANDSNGFTYRGRFLDDEQALTVSYEMSQKAHNALRWLVSDQGVHTLYSGTNRRREIQDGEEGRKAQIFYGGRTFLCWNPNGKRVLDSTLTILNFSAPVTEKTDYQHELRKTIAGFKSSLPDTEKVIIAAFDAATTGRLAVTYYNELSGSDYLQRLYDWDSTCCWYWRKQEMGTPLLIQIVSNAFGTQRTEKGKTMMKADDRVVRQQMQRLVACRIDSKQIPLDIIKALVNKASNPQAYEEKVWRNMIFTACAVLNKHYMDKGRTQKGNIGMGWTLDENDRSFQFGRLIAAMEKVEQDYYYQSGENGGDKKTRMTTAIKALNSFRQKPFSTYARVQEHLTQAYIPRLNQPARIRYEKLKGEIMGRIADYPKEDLNKPLEDIYLLGYDLQRNAFFTKTSGESMGEGETEKP